MDDIVTLLFGKAAESNPRIQQGAVDILVELSRIYSPVMIPVLFKGVIITSASGSSKWPPPKIVKARVTVLLAFMADQQLSPTKEVCFIS